MFILKILLKFIVNNRRYFFLGIVISCLLALVLSVSGLLQFTAYVKREKLPISKDEHSKRKQKYSIKYDPEDVTQEIYGLYLPNYDKDGKQVSVIRGAYTVLLKNNIYKITNPEIEFSSTSNEDGNQPENIITTSDSGEIDKATNEGFLYGNVIIRLEENFKIYTNDILYLPEEKLVKTDDLVTIKGEGIKITGTGFEISMHDSKAWIKNDPVMQVSSGKGQFFFFSDKKTVTSNFKNQSTAKNENIAEDIFIRSSGELVFENEKKLITFHDNVRISRGKSTVFSNKLSILFDSSMEDVRKVTASGNVLASDGTKTAKGESLSWVAEDQVATLEDDPVAEFYEDNVSIAASKIMFFKNENRVDVPVGGILTTKVKMKNKETDEQVNEAKLIHTSSEKAPTHEDITINWKKKMSFQQDKNLAIFEDDVVASKEGVKLYCGKLVVLLDNKKGMMHKLEATKDVHFIQKRGDSFSEARGSKIIWTTTGNYIELYGDRLASVKNSEMHLSAPKILFSEDENDLYAEGKGSLLVKSHSKKDNVTEFIDINWNKKMVYNDENKTANFYEKVVAIKGGEKLDCDRLDVLFLDKSKVKKITALGNVYLASAGLENTEGLGTLLVWDLPKGIAVLTGNPLAELRRSGTRTFSEKVYFDINTHRVHWEGKPHWRIY